MSLPIGKVLQLVQSEYSKGVQSVSTRLTYRHIYESFKGFRSKLLTEKANKKQTISQWAYQTLPCVELIPASIHECHCVPAVGCSALKTKYPIPKIIYGMDKPLIQSVTSLNGEIVYSESSWLGKKYKSGNKFTSGIPDYIVRNDNIIITHKGGPKIISITAVWDDPIDAALYPSYCKSECKGNECIECKSMLDFDFAIDQAMIPALIELTANSLIARFTQATEDATNNSRDTPAESSK